MSETMSNLPDKDDVLENEESLLRGLIEAGNFKNDEEFRRKIEIRRGDRVLFSFTVRPLDEEEEMRCYRQATEQRPHPNGKKFGTIDGRTDSTKMRSLKIYTATIDEDRKRIWDNQAFKKQFGVITGVEMIDKVLRSGDKDAVLAVIDEISGSGSGENGEVKADEPSLEEWAKN